MSDPSMQGARPAYAAPVQSGGALTEVNGVWSVNGAPVSSAGRRIGAALLDGVLLLVTLFIGWWIWSLVVWGRGQSPAKQLMKMRSVNKTTGECAGWGTMFVREFVGKTLIASITFGILMIVSFFMLFSGARETIWDKLSTTVVVDDPTGSLAP